MKELPTFRVFDVVVFACNLLAFNVPVVITPPLIEVTLLFTSPASIGVFVVEPSVKAAPLNVTSPLNPIACVVLPKLIV